MPAKTNTIIKGAIIRDGSDNIFQENQKYKSVTTQTSQLFIGLVVTSRTAVTLRFTCVFALYKYANNMQINRIFTITYTSGIISGELHIGPEYRTTLMFQVCTRKGLKVKA